jgi:hypothetical protein
VIASRHHLPPEAADNPVVIQRLLIGACDDSVVDVLGHPARGIEGLANMDWPYLFARAVATGTAVEINLNTYPLPHREPARERFWAQWLRWLAESGAWVSIGSDLHNAWQLTQLVRDWHPYRTGEPNRSLAALAALAKAGIAPERVINASWESFHAWQRLSKLERAAQTHSRRTMVAAF